jgi:hypothetical protein
MSDENIQQSLNDADVEKEVLEDEPKNMIMGILAQLKNGGDLGRISLPTFVLEPRSMLERITDFMSHPDLLIEVEKEKDDYKRFLGVLKYYLSGWHIKPKVRKKVLMIGC